MDDLDRIFATNRRGLEDAIGKARRELEDCRIRCRELEDRIRAAEGVLGVTAPGFEAGSGPQPTLRAAMKVVLRDEPRGLAAPEIARRIIERDLYRRPNGTRVDVGQVHNRVHHYPNEFIREDRRIHLA